MDELELATMRPPEDAGSRTFDKYEWQASVATRDLLVLLTNDILDRRQGRGLPHRALISEHWEDWILLDGPTTVIASGKHRDLDQGAWEWPELVGKGGLAHLYRNSRRLSGAFLCRLSTNNALHRSNTSPLGDFCLASDSASGSPRKQVQNSDFSRLCNKFAQHLLIHHKKAGLTNDEAVGLHARAQDCKPSSALLKTVDPFLRKLSLDTDIPGRRSIDSSAPTDYVQPVLRGLEHPIEHAGLVWKTLKDVVGQSMRAHLPIEWGELSTLVQHSNSDERKELPQDILRRRITTDQARDAIDKVVKRPRHFLVPEVPYRYKVSVKMKAGNCGANDIQRAEDRLETWQNATAAVDDSPGNHAQVEVFTKELLERVDDVEYNLKNQKVPEDDIGRRLWNDSIRLPVADFPELPFPLSRALLTGAVANAANQCLIWFTEARFDADALLREFGESNTRTLSPTDTQQDEP
ncbi:hypothetical protein ACIRPH_28860 [Nocardiopsis sp. NPDC101807]|uniref:hypothetical protein n=1 Tax=Nocardiopsis sp. NPDC101807 TaxID=3364339 RepID=UPI0038076BA3